MHLLPTYVYQGNNIWPAQGAACNSRKQSVVLQGVDLTVQPTSKGAPLGKGQSIQNKLTSTLSCFWIYKNALLNKCG